MVFIQSSEIIHLQQNTISKWKEQGIVLTQTEFLLLVEKNHAFNLQLWHAEDRARRDDMGHTFVYLAKREIDDFNQQRNNLVQAIDECLFEALHPSLEGNCPVHSETPGMMIDRLSILALKKYHMLLQTERTDVEESHRLQCHQKSRQLTQQQNQLARCFDTLLEEINNKTRTFSVYYQHKMYNDPRLNPELYCAT